MSISVVELSILIFIVAFLIIFVGFLLILLGTLKGVSKSEERKVEAGGVVIVGPIPIVFGTTTRITKILLILAIALTIIVLVVYLIMSGVIRVVV